MENILPHILIGIVTFAVTNIDDLLLLSFYFARPEIKRSNIIIGQYLGVIALVIISLAGLLLGKIATPPIIGLLGFLPVFLGLKDLIGLFYGNSEDQETPQSSGIHFLNIALITIANGSDNIGVYTPLFANSPVRITVSYILIFLIMIAVWCMIASYLVKHPWLKKIFSRYGHWLLPFFLIFLGIYILYESGSFKLLGFQN